MAPPVGATPCGPIGQAQDGQQVQDLPKTMPMQPRFFVPEVVQTSEMDCGPASLKALLEGFGISASYGRLREACQTEVDGTSIDVIEQVAIQLGLDAEQIMIPADHLLLTEAKALPALVVVRLPNGMTHFIIIWSKHGRFIQVMDPGPAGVGWTKSACWLICTSTASPCPRRRSANGPARTAFLRRCAGGWLNCK